MLSIKINKLFSIARFLLCFVIYICCLLGFLIISTCQTPEIDTVSRVHVD